MKGLSRELICLMAARELKDGMYVNLGFGLPTLVSNFLPPGEDIILHSENGILGYGSITTDPAKMDIDLVNASGQPVSLNPGGCFFDFSVSFGIIRGRHLDATILGAYQVSEKGDIANWKMNPTMKSGGIGGAMELAIGARKVIITMEHATRDNQPRIVKKCSLPLTALRAANVIITNLAYIVVTPKGLVLEKVAPGVTPEEVQQLTEPKLILSPNLREMEL